ncbi:MAG: LPS assembly lipoprotein LptE [Steroidobacteraceae bacterium]
MGRCLPLVLLSLGLLAGCGFQLRGAGKMPAVLERPYVEAADRYTPFHAALLEGLALAGTPAVEARAEATAVIRVHRDRVEREVLTISARNTPEEYELFYTVEFSVEVEGQEVLPRQVLTLVRDYAYDETAVLAMQHEEEDIRRALARELVVLVTARLSALPAMSLD